MIIIPYSHEKFEFYKLPFVTISLIVLCIIIFFGTFFRQRKNEEVYKERKEALQLYYLGHEYLSLPEEFVNDQPRLFKQRYEANQDWLKWYNESPEEVDEFLGDMRRADVLKGPSGAAEEYLKKFGRNPASRIRGMKKVAENIARDPERKRVFVSHLRWSEDEDIKAEQEQLDLLYEDFKLAETSNIHRRYGSIPAKPRLLNRITSLFLHMDIFQLLFNMLILWIAGAKLEDMWGKPIILAAFFIFGLIGDYANQLAHPDSLTPLVGASGAIAGLMGVFAVRLYDTKMRYFWAYFFFDLTPRWGTFEAKAIWVLPIWFITQIAYGLILGLETVAYWSQIASFFTGAAVGLVFLVTKFEENVLGYEDIDKYYEQDIQIKDIVVFEHADKKGIPKSTYGAQYVADTDSERHEHVKDGVRQAREDKLDRNLKSDVGLPQIVLDDELDKPDRFVPGEKYPHGISYPTAADEKQKQRALRGVEAMDTRRIEEARNMARKKEDGFDSLAMPEKFSDLSRFNLDQEPVPGFKPPGSVPETDDDPTIRDACAAQNIIDEGITHDVVKHVPSPRFDGRFASGAIDVLEDSTKPEYTDGSARHAESKPRLNTKEISVVIWGGMDAFEFNEVTVTGLEPEGLEAVAYGNVPMLIHIDDVHFIAAGSIEKLNPVKDAVYFHDGIPDAPIYVMVIVAGQDASKMPRVLRGYFIDGEHLPYDDLLTKAGDSLRGNFWEFAKLIKSFFPDAHFIHKRGAVQREGLPIYATLEEFLYEIRAQT